MPDVLPDDELQAGNSLNSVSTQLATLIGPGIAGIMVSRFLPGIGLAIDALSFVVSAVTLAIMYSGRASAISRDIQNGELAIASPLSLARRCDGSTLGADFSFRGEWCAWTGLCDIWLVPART